MTFALAEINEQITRLTPAILGETPVRAVTIESEDGAKVDVLARQCNETLNDGLYMFCVNYDERLKKTKARINVENLAAGTDVTVIDERRTIKSMDGFFVDTFEPLDVHIYRVAGFAK